MKSRFIALLAVVFVLGQSVGLRAEDAVKPQYTINIDAGHGNDSEGNRSRPYEETITHSFRGKTVTVQKGETFKEHWANVGIAVGLEKILTQCGFRVVKSGWNDDNALDDIGKPADGRPESVVRHETIRNARADVSISIHNNAASRLGAQGLETFYWEGHEQSRLLAEHLQSQLIALYGQVDRGVKSNVFFMTNNEKMGTKAACLVEYCFMTNWEETSLYFSNPEAWFNYAVATARGICNFLNVPYTGPKPTVQKSEPVIPEGRANFQPGQ